jgi:AmmeMemoRadiSam system protein B
MNSIRRADHAGSWYTNNGKQLLEEVQDYLKNAGLKKFGSKKIRAIIGPHAGLSYSGPTSGHAYKEIDASKISKVFLIGPSHHFYLKNCALSSAKIYETPIHNLNVDRDVVETLKSTGKFMVMSKAQDEDEHSLELHTPFIAKIVKENPEIKIVPILVGQGGLGAQKDMASILLPYFEDEKNLFVLSSDFCHWGQRFRYTNYYKDATDGKTTKIYKGIEAMDRHAMQIIERLDSNEFLEYLNETENTICGRNPISIFLQMVELYHENAENERVNMEFLDYSQSSQVKSEDDSSVSYAAGCAYV